MKKITDEKKKIIVFFISLFLLIILIASLITTSIFLANEIKWQANGSNNKIFIFASIVGISAFLIILLLLNFSTFLTSNKTIIKKIWIRDKND